MAIVGWKSRSKSKSDESQTEVRDQSKMEIKIGFRVNIMDR